MRILMTTDTVGGVWTFTKELVTGLLRSGHAVALASFGREPLKEQSAWCARRREECGSAFLYESSSVPLEWMEENNAAYDGAERALLRIADEFQPDLFHTNQYCFGHLPLHVPKLITAHSDVFSWAEACRPNGLVPSPWLSRYTHLVQRGLEDADAVVAPTRSMLHALLSAFTVSSTSYVIPNGRTVSLPAQSGPRELQAVTAGRLWDNAKNIKLLSQVKAPFSIFAVGEQQYLNATAPEPMGGLQLLGPMTEQDLLSFYGRSNLYLATSIYEPFGLAPLEAALCGCAVIANDIPSLREVWADCAVYFKTANELSGILEHMSISVDARNEARRKSYLRACEFSAERMTHAYTVLYRQLVLAAQESSTQELTTIAC